MVKSKRKFSFEDMPTVPYWWKDVPEEDQGYILQELKNFRGTKKGYISKLMDMTDLDRANALAFINWWGKCVKHLRFL